MVLFSEGFLFHSSFSLSGFNEYSFLTLLMIVFLVSGVSLALLMSVSVRSFPYIPDASFSEEFP